MSEFNTPQCTESTGEAAEVLRVCIVNQELQCTLQADAFEEPSTWGALLANLMQTIAQVLQERDGLDPQDALDQMLASFKEELADSGDWPDDDKEE